MVLGQKLSKNVQFAEYWMIWYLWNTYKFNKKGSVLQLRYLNISEWCCHSCKNITMKGLNVTKLRAFCFSALKWAQLQCGTVLSSNMTELVKAWLLLPRRCKCLCKHLNEIHATLVWFLQVSTFPWKCVNIRWR